MSNLYSEHGIRDWDPLNPKPVAVEFVLTDAVFNRLLLTCDALHIDINDYVHKALIAQMKKDKLWY